MGEETESDSEDEEVYTKKTLQSKKVSELQDILKSIHKHIETKTKSKKKSELIDEILDYKTGGGSLDDRMIYGGGVSKLKTNFRGWGFTFLR